jgi:hypothetical protein
MLWWGMSGGRAVHSHLAGVLLLFVHENDTQACPVLWAHTCVTTWLLHMQLLPCCDILTRQLLPLLSHLLCRRRTLMRP